MGIVGSYQYPTMESVIYGKPAAEEAAPVKCLLSAHG